MLSPMSMVSVSILNCLHVKHFEIGSTFPKLKIVKCSLNLPLPNPCFGRKFERVVVMGSMSIERTQILVSIGMPNDTRFILKCTNMLR